MHLERVGEHTTLEGYIFLRHARMIRMLNIDSGNVISKQQNLVAIDLIRVLVRQLFSRNKLLILQQVHHEGARTRKRIEDAHALVGQTLPEFFSQNSVSSVQNVVHHLVRGINDAHLLRCGLECLAEEFLVEFLNDLLLSGVAANGLGAQAHAGVQLRQLALLGLGLDAVTAKRRHHRFHSD